MAIDDIEGTRSRAIFKGGDKPRAVNQLDDINGTRSIIRHKPRPGDQSYSNMDYKDVTQNISRSNRCSNPLAPEYVVMAEEKGKTETIGFVPGSKPTLLGNAPPKKKNLDIMKTSDIHGAAASSKGLGVFANAERRPDQMKSSFIQGDVPGAAASSLRKGPQTKRCTNPLTGDYQIPGHSELETADPYSKSKKDKVKPSTLGASGAKQMGIASRAASPAPYGLDADMTEHKQVSFKKSYGEFYGVDQNSASKIDYNALHKASRTKIA